MNGYFACVTHGAGWSAGLTYALDRALDRIRLGRVAGIERRFLSLSIASDSPATLAEVARVLAGLAPPPGTWVGHAECPRMIEVDRLTVAHPAASDVILKSAATAGAARAKAPVFGTDARLLAALERATGRLH